MTYPPGGYPGQPGPQPSAPGGWQQPQQPPAYGPPPGYGPPPQQPYGPPPQQYAPPGYGPGPGGYPPPFQPAPAKKSSAGLIVALVVVAALVVIGGGVGAVLYFANKGGTPTGTPTQSVEAFLTAAYTDNDSAGAAKWVVSDNLTAVQAAIERGRKPKGATTSAPPQWSGLKERVQGSTAAVTASVEWPAASTGGAGKPVSFWGFSLKVDDGQWKITNFIIP